MVWNAISLPALPTYYLIHVLIYLNLKEADKLKAILEYNNSPISPDSINNNDVPPVSVKYFTILDHINWN